MDDKELLNRVNAIWKGAGGKGSASFVSTLLKFNRQNTDIEFFNEGTAFYAVSRCKKHCTLYFIATLKKGKGEGRSMFLHLCNRYRNLGKEKIRLKAHEDVRGFYEKLGCRVVDFDTKDNSYVMEYKL